MDNTQLGGYQYALPYPGGATQEQQPQLKMAPPSTTTTTTRIPTTTIPLHRTVPNCTTN